MYVEDEKDDGNTFILNPNKHTTIVFETTTRNIIIISNVSSCNAESIKKIERYDNVKVISRQRMAD